jgi:hypothetical protein
VTEQEIQELANRLIAAIESLAPGEPSIWSIISSLAPVAALLAAGLVTFMGWKNLEHQQKALAASNTNDDRTQWWKRVEWALDAAMKVENTRLAKMGNELLRVLSTSKMASDADKDLLDSVWKAGTDAVTQESAEDAIAEAAAYNRESDLDGDSETSENEGTKEVDHG